MRAMVFDHYGEPEVMSLGEELVPEPQDGELLIRVGFAGVNPSDSKARSGESARAGYRVRDFEFFRVSIRHGHGCCRCCGANGVERQWIQARRSRDHLKRCGRQNVGQLCGIHASSGEECPPMPKSLSFAQAAAVPVAALTALQALFHAEKGGGMIPGQKVLINGAAGGVGSFAVQFAKSGGLRVAATCGANNVAYVRSLGADRVIDTLRCESAPAFGTRSQGRFQAVASSHLRPLRRLPGRNGFSGNGAG